MAATASSFLSLSLRSLFLPGSVALSRPYGSIRKRNQTRASPGRRMVGGFPYCECREHTGFCATFRQRSACQQRSIRSPRFIHETLLVMSNHERPYPIVCGFASRNVSTNPHFSNRDIHSRSSGRSIYRYAASVCGSLRRCQYPDRSG